MPDNRKPLIYGAFPVCRNYTVRAHIRNDGNLQRRGCENPVQYAGPLQRRVHSGHLHAHHQRYAKGRGGENRRLHGIGHGSQHPGTSRSAGGESVQGDTVREGGIKATRPKGQDCVPWASPFRQNCNSKALKFILTQQNTIYDFLLRLCRNTQVKAFSQIIRQYRTFVFNKIRLIFF